MGVAAREDTTEAQVSFVSLLDAYLRHPNEKDVPVSLRGDQSGKTPMAGSSLNTSHGISIPGYVWGWGVGVEVEVGR